MNFTWIRLQKVTQYGNYKKSTLESQWSTTVFWPTFAGQLRLVSATRRVAAAKIIRIKTTFNLSTHLYV